MNIKKLLLLGGVGLLSGTVGVLLPVLVVGKPSAAESSPHDEPAAGGSHEASHDPKKDAPKADPHASGGHSGGGDHGASGGHGGGHGEAKAPPKEGPCSIHFGDVVVNLNEPNLIRYLSVDISVMSDEKYRAEVTPLLEEKRALLKTWLISHLADKSLEDIRGKVGYNRLRRDIQDNFNLLLFKDGQERIQDILFEEFHIQ